MNMRQRLALAIANVDDTAGVILGRGAFTSAEWKGFETMSNAFLDALMEPTEAMEKAYYEAHAASDGAIPTAREAWQAMLRAAREGK